MELLERIEKQGEQEAQRIIAEAEEQVKKMLLEEEQKIREWVEAFKREQQAKIEQEKRLLLGRARAKAWELMLSAKGGAAAALFETLSMEAAGLRAQPQSYKRFLETCLREAEREIPEPLVLQIDRKDEPLFRELLTNSKHQIGGFISTLGGFIASNANGTVVVDNRLETRIANLKNIYRAELSKVLFDRARPD